MIDFPITDLFDDSLCLVWLERHLHPEDQRQENRRLLWLCFKLARCAQTSAPQRPERSPTIQAHQIWHLSWPAPAGGREPVDHHIWHIIFMPTS